MKQPTTKLILFSFFTFLFLPPSLYAIQTYDETAEGIFHGIKHIPGEMPQLHIGDTWYKVDSRSTIFVCGQEDKQKSIYDLTEFTNDRLNLTPSPDSHFFNKINILCE